MSRFLDVKDFQNDASCLSWPIVVIGSGPAGAFAAIRLAELGHRVLLLEAGDGLPDMNWSNYFELASDDDAKRRDALGLSWQIGGSSNLWSGRSAPLEATDICSAKGWPISSAELDPFYAAALARMGLRQIVELGEKPFAPEMPAPWDELFNTSLSLKRFQWCTPPMNTAKALEDAVQINKDLTVVTGCRLLSLGPTNRNGRVETGLFAMKGGETIQVAGGVFILATGGIETPRILLNSASGKGLGNSSGNLGRYLSTHPKMNIGTVELNRPVRVSCPLFSDVRISGTWLRYGIGLPQTPDISSPLNHYVQLTSRFEKVGNYFLEQAQSQFLTKVGGLRSRRFLPSINSFAVMLGRVIFNALGRSGIWRRSARRLTVKGYFDQYPNPECRVTLDTRRDCFDLPKARIHWELSERDVHSIRAFAEDIRKRLREAGVGEMDIELPLASSQWAMTGVHSHFMGTTRMGTDPTQSVTNAYGRLHDVENVYISGPSLFPSYGYANPFLTIVALALRIAEEVNRKIKSGVENASGRITTR